jgi:electron transfer flavoprotein-quinone oxidoreductase
LFLSQAEDKFDSIIVGAGPAGSACAYTLAKAGKNVLLIERGDTPGAKNVTGGRIYTYALEMLEPGLYAEAALERRVTHEQIMLLGGERAITVDFHQPGFNAGDQAPMSFTILRAVFDEWLAAKAEEAGAIVACGIKVDRLIEQEGRIVGVVAGEDEMYADVVIAADGVNSLMAQEAGLIKDIAAKNVGVGVKEVIELPEQTISERFNLRTDEGAARMLLGCTEGIHGGGFLYTNKQSISLGCVFTPEEVARHRKSVQEIFQDLKMHPAIAPLIADGESIEYSAHLVSEAGFRGIHPRLYREGFLMVGDAAGFVVNTGYSIRGIDLAIVSGIAAAKAIIAAAENIALAGPNYMQELNRLKLMPTMKATDGYFEVLETPWLYDKIPNLANDVMEKLFKVDGETPSGVKENVLGAIKANGLSIWQLTKLGIKGVRSL